MKTLHLRDENYSWKTFEYKELSDLVKEFKSNNITIGYRASIGCRASIGYETSIGDKIELTTGFYINGSKHAVTYVGNNKLSIGCHCFKISNWKKNYKKLGKEDWYSDAQIKEYYQYILMAEKFAKV